MSTEITTLSSDLWQANLGLARATLECSAHLRLGTGHGPLNHFAVLYQEAGREGNDIHWRRR